MGAPTIATPTTSVVGSGTCTYQQVAPLSGVDASGTNVTLYPYTFTATPAQGWQFVRFIITSSQGVINNSTGVETVYPPGTAQTTTNPLVLRSDFATSEVVNWYYYSWLGAFGYDKPTGYTYYHKTWNITAVFERVYAPTHLLVNSSTVESPAKLVYDPTTNLLVADY